MFQTGCKKRLGAEDRRLGPWNETQPTIGLSYQGAIASLFTRIESITCRLTWEAIPMVQALRQPLTLHEFLQLPETKPASEYINGEIIQKPMPKGRYSRLQGKLCATINQVAEETKIAYAFPELRCSFGIRSIVPDVAVFQWERIPFTAEGNRLVGNAHPTIYQGFWRSKTVYFSAINLNIDISKIKLTDGLEQ